MPDRKRTTFDRKCLSLFAGVMNLTAKVFLGAIFLGALATAQAQLVWEEQTIELHPKAGDAEAVANFKYQNKGGKPIRINNVRSSCGCTVASLKKNEVAPGEKGEVTATFKIGGRTGLQQKTVTVETDDPDAPTTNLLLKAVIEQALEIQPVMVYWENGEAPKPKTIKLKANKDVSITKVDVGSSVPEFTTRVEKGSAPGEFNIAVQPKETTRAINTTLTIKSDLPQPFYASARVMPPAAAAASDR